MSMIDASETERRIAERIDPAAAGAMVLSQEAGGLGFSNMAEAMNFAKIMAISGFAVPKHLRGNVGACMAITIQAVEWKLSPFAVANKSYLVNDRLGYESQLIQAVILQRAPITGRFKVEFSGEGERRRCTVTATLKEGGEKDYTSPEIGKIPIKNSPLWKNDPDQQLAYYSGRALCRRHFPDVLLGIYSPDELYEDPRRGPEHARDVTPKKPVADALDVIAASGNGDPATGEVISSAAEKIARNTGIDKTSEVMTDDAAMCAAEQAFAGAAEGQRLGKSVQADREASLATPDLQRQLLIDAGHAAATNGKAEYHRWEDTLGAPDFELLGAEINALRKAAAKADRMGG